ncbi:MAG: methylmalonyl-CoA mutase, partial [Zetaproteobacteria bacterium]|nr:methylmalonyl-CoA mutase [Flavobacteriales bacterium]
MKKLSYQEFDAVAAKQWKQNIQSGLNGADYNSALLTQTNEGVNINPFYHQDQT